MLIKIEKQIKNEISYKNNLISCLYEITKKDLIKHSKAFYMIIKLKQNESKQNYNNICILEKSLINKLINRELNFIFNISDKNNIIKKDKKYLYIKNYIKSKNKVIYKNIETYGNISNKINKFIIFKNFTIIGLLFPITKKEIIYK